MQLKLLIVNLLLCCCIVGIGQRKSAHTSMLWVNYNNTVAINDKWSWSNDFQFRTRDWAKYLWQFAVRTGAQYNINKKWTAAAGIAWFDNIRYYNDNPVFPNEWRPWVEIGLQLKPGKTGILQRFRFEERFLQKVIGDKKLKEYETRERLRYRLQFTFPRIGKNVELHIGDEVMVNLNHLNDSLFFDQNRIFFIANVWTGKASFLQFQFIKNFQLLSRNYTLEEQYIFRFSFHQQLRWHRTQQQKK